jgi:hypothetical protein
MSLERLEHIANLSFKADMSSAESALKVIGAEIDESILENTYLIANLPYFIPEIINGVIKFTEQEHITVKTKHLQDLMTILLKPESALYNEFVACFNEMVKNNESKYHHLIKDDFDKNQIYTPLAIYYHLLKNYGSESPLFKLFTVLFNKYYHYILSKSRECKMDIIPFIEWILMEKNYDFYQSIFDTSSYGKQKNIGASLYIQGCISKNLTHKIDIGLHIYLEPFLNYDNNEKVLINLSQTQTGDKDEFGAFETSIELDEIKANRMCHKYHNYRFAIDFSSLDTNPFGLTLEKPSFFNFRDELSCYIEIKKASASLSDNENDDEPHRFTTEYDYDVLAIDDVDLLNMLLNARPIDNLFDIEVI